MKFILSIITILICSGQYESSDKVESKQLIRKLVPLFFSSHNDDQNKKEFSSFSILDSEAIYKKLMSLAESYPNYSTLENAQDVYNLLAAGNETDCLFEKTTNATSDKGCKNWIFTIEDKTEASDKKLPEIFLSAGIHGDEIIGPTALVELASLLLEVSHCESLPNAEAPSSSDWDDQLTEALYCRRALASRGITNYYRKWIARLVTTRRILILPIVNSLGFYRKEHLENNIDPATDFPFDKKNSKRCMETISARAINEIFRNHMFYIAVNFHSGNQQIAYNWAKPSYLGAYAPDNEAQKQIATGLASFAGMNNWEAQHLIGPMNKLDLKTTKGTMLDWAYAGSWSDTNMPQCNPTTYDGYPEDKTVYNDSHLRTLSMLVDFSAFKKPSSGSHLGSKYDLFHPHSFDDGDIPRLLRASLMMIDIVEPYITIKSIHGISIQDDIVPSTADRWSYTKSKSISIPHGTSEIEILWEVGGAFSVDVSNLVYVKLKSDGNGPQQKTVKELLDSFYKSVDGEEGFFSSSSKTMLYETPGKSGNTRWNQSPSDMQPIFQSKINITAFDEGDHIAVFAIAQVDNMWEDQPDKNVVPDLPPQSHLVNTRLNPCWYHENAGRIAKGQVQWFSMPVTLVIGPSSSKTKELNPRIPLPIKSYNSERKIQDIMFVAIASVLLFAFAGLVVYRKRRPSLQKEKNKRKSRVSMESEEYDDEYLEKIYRYSLNSSY